MSFSNRAYYRTVVLLDKRLQAVPGNLESHRLQDAGRVKEISFTKNCSAARIGELLQSNFAFLAGKDLTKLEFIVSYSRGHSMKKVATGLQSGEQLMELFGGTRKKRVFLYLPTGIPASATPPISTPSVSISATSVSISTPSSVLTAAPSSVSISTPSPVLTVAPSSVSISTPSSVLTVAPSSVSISALSSVPTHTTSSVSTPMFTPISTPSSVSTPTSTPSSISTTISTPSSTSTTISTPSAISTTMSTPSSISTPISTPSSISTTISTPSAISTTISTPSSVFTLMSTPSSVPTPTPSSGPTPSTASVSATPPVGSVATRRYLTAMAAASRLTVDDNSDSDDNLPSIFDAHNNGQDNSSGSLIRISDSEEESVIDVTNQRELRSPVLGSSIPTSCRRRQRSSTVTWSSTSSRPISSVASAAAGLLQRKFPSM